MRHTFRPASFVVAVGLLPLLSLRCTDAPSIGGPRLSESASTLERLATGVVAGLVTADTQRLEQPRLTEFEHNELVWPELPASQPPNNFPIDVAWANIESRNSVALRRLLPLFEGRAVVATGVECRGETETFESFTVRTDCWVRLERAGTPIRARQLFKDVLVWQGQHKIFRYYEP